MLKGGGEVFYLKRGAEMMEGQIAMLNNKCQKLESRIENLIADAAAAEARAEAAEARVAELTRPPLSHTGGLAIAERKKDELDG